MKWVVHATQHHPNYTKKVQHDEEKKHNVPNGFEPTNLGIDATIGNEQVGTDLSESDLLELLSGHDGPTTLLLSPMGCAMW